MSDIETDEAEAQFAERLKDAHETFLEHDRIHSAELKTDARGRVYGLKVVPDDPRLGTHYLWDVMVRDQLIILFVTPKEDRLSYNLVPVERGMPSA